MADDELGALIVRARQRDPDAWEALYRRNHAQLLSYARRRLPGREQAEDAVSETMVRALDGLHRFSSTGHAHSFDGWMYGILRNVVLEMGRRTVQSPTAPLIDLVSDAPEPGDAALRSETAATVRRAFDRLSADDQELLELRVVGELDAAAIGHVIGKQPGAVRTAQSRALGRLRELLRGVSL